MLGIYYNPWNHYFFLSITWLRYSWFNNRDAKPWGFRQISLRRPGALDQYIAQRQISVPHTTNPYPNSKHTRIYLKYTSIQHKHDISSYSYPAREFSMHDTTSNSQNCILYIISNIRRSSDTNNIFWVTDICNKLKTLRFTYILPPQGDDCYKG